MVKFLLSLPLWTAAAFLVHAVAPDLTFNRRIAVSAIVLLAAGLSRVIDDLVDAYREGSQ